MDIRKSLYLQLKSHTGLAALVSNRIYPILKPQNPTYPCVTLTLINGGEEYTHSGKVSLEDVIFQISCWAETVGDVFPVAVQVKKAIQGLAPAEVINELDLYEDESKLFHIAIEVMFHFQADLV